MGILRHNIQMHAVAWAGSHITGNGRGNPKYYGEFVSDAPYVTSGGTSDGTPTKGTPRVIRLID